MKTLDKTLLYVDIVKAVQFSINICVVFISLALAKSCGRSLSGSVEVRKVN